LVAFYDIWPGNGVGLFLKPRSTHGATVGEMTSVAIGKNESTARDLETLIYCLFYSNFVPKTRRFWDILLDNYTVTLKPGLGVTEGHRNWHVSIQRLWDGAKFSHPPYILLPCWRGSPWNWVPGTGVRN